MIGQHPELMGLPEVNLFAAETYRELARIYLFREYFQHGLLRAVAELGLGDQTEENIEIARNWLRETPSISTAELFQDLADWSSTRALVDKSPLYVFVAGSFERIHRAYPEARFLHLVRHPRGTCESVYKIRDDIQHRIDNMPLDDSARQTLMQRASVSAKVQEPERIWLQPHKRILEFLASIPEERRLRVRGEDLMARPREHLKNIAEWLRIESDPASIEAMMHPERSPFACIGPPNAKYGNDPNFLERPTLRAYTPKPMNLDDPLSVGGGVYMNDETKQYASFFGY